MAMRPTAPTLRPVHVTRALSADISDADARRLDLTVAKQTVNVVRRVTDVWLEQPIDDRWMAAYRIVTSGGKPRVAEVRIFPLEDFATRPPGEWSGGWKGVEATAPRQGLTKEVLGRVRLHEWTTQTRAILAWMEKKLGRQYVEPIMARFGLPLPVAVRATSGSRRGRPSLSDEFYARIAAEYVAALKAGRPPVQAIAKQRRAPEPRVRGWIHRARYRGLLEGRGQGTTVGELSEKAIFVLEAAKQSRRTQRRSIRRK